MKNVIIALGLLNGIYMIVDGVFVMVKGKYIGPERPGPWAIGFEKLGFDVFRLGPMFIMFGVAWIAFVVSFSMEKPIAVYIGLLLSILTLWYLPFGTVISIAVMILLILSLSRA